MNIIDKVLGNQTELEEETEKQVEFLKGPRKANEQVKKLLNISFENALETQMDIEGLRISENSESNDGLEGMRAFSEKRRPNFD